MAGPPNPARAPRRESIVLIAGLIVAAALAWVATIDFGDPREAARARATQEARLGGLATIAAWREIQARDEAPPGALGPEVRLVDAAPAAATTTAAADASPGPADRTLDLLLDAAVAEEARGRLDEAISLAHAALARAAPRARRRAEAHLLLARVWTALGEPVAAGPHRAEAAAAPAELTAGGVPVALLAHLVAPMNAAGAAATLRAGAADVLFQGGGALEIDRTAGLRLREPPLVLAVRDRLARALPPAEIDAALGVERRVAEAIRAGLERDGVAPPADRWIVHDLGAGEGRVALRGEAGGRVRAIAVDRHALTSHLATLGRAAWLDRHSEAFLIVRFADHPLKSTRPAEMFGPVELEDLGARVWAGNDAYALAAGPEIRRIRLIRVGLVLLALMTAGAAAFTARTLRAERRLVLQRETFVASVSHDLRTPAQALLLLAEALDDGRARSEETRADYHRRIRVEAERLRRLVDDVLDASRVGRGMRPRLAPREVETAAFVETLERDLAERADQIGASLSIARAPLPARLEIDPDAVRRAVWNLFENALRHGRRGDAPARVEVAIAYDTETLTFTIDDEGPGVPAKLRERVFRPFERGASGGIAEDTGTGLGLSIVRAIAVAHGGDARADANDRGGARFIAHFGRARGGGAA